MISRNYIAWLELEREVEYILLIIRNVQRNPTSRDFAIFNSKSSSSHQNSNQTMPVWIGY